MLDRALSRTFANLSTLLLVAFVFTVPLHVIHALVYRDALAVQEISPEINTFPEGRQVRGIAKGDLTAERNALFLVLGVEVLLLPLAYRAARRVISADDEGMVPTVADAWAHLRGSPPGSLSLGPTAVAAAIGAICAALLWSITNRLADMASADTAWAVFGLGRATAVGMFVALATGTAAALPAKTSVRPEKDLDLY